MTIRTYSELVRLGTFRERYEYLRLDGQVGQETFGFDRYLNQMFYKTKEWLSVRDMVITRDNGCDLGMAGHDIFGRILIHHMNPITKQDILERSDLLLNPKYLICVMDSTHNAIHYGNEEQLIATPIERARNDTCPWRANQ